MSLVSHKWIIENDEKCHSNAITNGNYPTQTSCSWKKKTYNWLFFSFLFLFLFLSSSSQKFAQSERVWAKNYDTDDDGEHIST